ncbi:PAS domain S-box protein [Cryptosporangium aurantiacum]|uniref:PAS domain S-box protein n=1 Tax=Cryptosporangium aurantiacum TaxID=134849 RepID=UPI0015BC58F1|nr:PAS domain S-box protein [Cryptosporangium aurantiacum]
MAEEARLGALRATGLTGEAPAPSLDRLTALAARLLRVPVALVSLVEADRQVFASDCGLSGELAVSRQTPLSHSYCKYVVADDAPLVVADARTHERLRTNPAIVDYDAIAYAGFPLHSPEGHVLGSFCVTDTKVRQWSEEELEILRDLAAAAESEIALRLAHGEVLLTAARMQAVLDSANDAYVSIDAAGQVTAWNAAAEHLFGFSAAEALGRPVTELIVPAQYRAAHEAGLARVRATGVSALAGRRLEMAAVDHAGREFPIEMTLQVSVERGEPRFHAFLHDITARKAAQVQLEEERRRLADERTFLHTVLDSLDTGVAACDPSGQLLVVNRAMSESHGGVQPRDLETWAGELEVYGTDERTRLGVSQLPVMRALRGETVRGQQLAVHGQDGAFRRFLANAGPIVTPDGRRLGAVVALHDVTEAHRAEGLRRARHAVAQVLSEVTSAQQAAIGAVAAIAGELGWACGEYWEVSDDRSCIARVSSWTAPGRDLTVFTGDGPLAMERGQGLAGAVWQRGTEVWSSALPRDIPNFTRAGAARRAGLQTGIGVPVRSGRRVLGVLAFFTDADLPHDPDVLAMLDAVSAHLGRFVERRRAEELTLALAAARRDFDRIVEQVNDYLWTVEIRPDGTVQSVYASPDGSAVFGGDLPTDADLAQVLADRMHPDDLPAFAAFHAQVSAGDSASVECRVLGYDGVTRWVWTRASARYEHGRLFVDGVCTDISRRKAVEADLAATADRLRTARDQLAVHKDYLTQVLDAIEVTVITCDTDGTIVHANRNARRALPSGDGPLSITEAIPRVALAYPDGTPVPVGETPLMQALNGTHVDGLEATIPRPDGTRRSLLLHARPLRDTHGAIIGAVAASHDITALREREAELRAFAGVVAHDLKAPLAAIAGYAELIADTLGSENASDAAATGTMLTRLQAGVDRMRHLIDDLLGYATARDSHLQPHDVDLNTVVADIVTERTAHLPAAGAEPPRIRVSRLPIVHADPVLTRQLLDNLIGNALKYTRPGQPATIDITAELGADQPGHARIHVADRGIGIPAADQPHVFGTFYRVNAHRTYAGTGLGLAICHQIVHRHGGAITAADNPGGGTLISFTLPVT